MTLASVRLLGYIIVKQHLFEKDVILDLPGVVGELSFSRDSKELFFSHYLADTNKDSMIDGNDHAVIYSMDFPSRKTYSISEAANFNI